MPLLERSIPVVLVLCLCSCFPNASASDLHAVTIEPFTLKTFDGEEHAAELGRITVPENRLSQSQRLIEVAFVRLPHRGAQPGTPVVFLPPGPGIPASTLGRVPIYFRLFDRLRDTGDVILLDIRGEGMSSPNLDDCPPSPTISARSFESFEFLVEQTAASVSHCAAFWRSKGLDLSAYNNQEIAEDIHELRGALKYSRISLLGFSAGTELGVEILRLHGDEIERAVFAATGAAELRPDLPSTYDLQLDKVAAWYKADGVDRPNLVDLFDEDVKTLDQQLVAMTLTDGEDKHPVTVKVGSVALKAVVTQMLNGSVPMLPALLTSVHERDYSLLQVLVQKMFSGFHGSMALVGRTIDCSAAMPPGRVARVQDEARVSRFGDVRNVHLQPAVCRAVLGSAVPTELAHSPLFSTVSTLFISGSMDANTPPFNAATLLWGFPNGIQILIENGFHETLPSSDVQSLVLDFLNGRSVANRNMTFDRPEYLSLDVARVAAQRSR
jgi:pimeloyl-ACP methyl ester carboxylesterase